MCREKVLEIFRRIESVIVFKHEHNYYEVVEVKGKSTEPYIELACLDVETKEEHKFKLSIDELFEPLLFLLQAECQQFLIVDIDNRKWRCYSITEQVKKILPFLRKLDKRQYIV